MNITKRGSFNETQKQKEKQKLENIKQEIESVKNWSMNCTCSSCTTEFIIKVNDIARAYFDEEGVSLYGCACPVCRREFTFSASTLPMIGQKRYTFKSYYPEYDKSPGYVYLMEIFHKNRVECCDRVENGYPKRRSIFRRHYY